MAGNFFEEVSAVKKNSKTIIELLSNAIALNSTAYEARDEAGAIVCLLLLIDGVG